MASMGPAEARARRRSVVLTTQTGASLMWWLSGVAVLVVVLGLLEWRSWKKPLPRRLQQDWRVNTGKESGRAITGGHTFDSPHD